MTADSASINLTHHFLIAMPGLEDETFAKSVVYVCEHSERGALGLVINKPGELSMKGLFDKVDLPLHRQDLMNAPVLQGGPVHTERGFVLHDAMWAQAAASESPQDASQLPSDEGGEAAQEAAKEAAALSAVSDKESVYASTMIIPGGLEMTTSKDVLEALSIGAGPKRVLISLGYSAWGEGQLESELAENSWLTVGADMAVIFDTPVEQRYERAMKLLGLESWMLSSEVGHS
ncbi:YqgE/AlgH family protein [Limnohabitans sp.]|uniref:YqgE/AlgH family protein n=1 Tax=Limnohabitans sp. TaxID=1907725 RepID=UPI00286F7C10|nr:YqgE/AlgH family protein [Limnohabitans sp.]